MEQSEDDVALTRFVQLLDLRRKHPVFRRSKFLTGKPVGDSGLKDVMWLAPEGREMATADWTNPSGSASGLWSSRLSSRQPPAVRMICF